MTTETTEAATIQRNFITKEK